MNREHVRALNSSFKDLKERQKDNPLADSEERKKLLKLTRNKSVLNEKLIELSIERLKKNGIRVFTATTREEANKIILEQVGNERIVVKSKSNVTKELDLTNFLEGNGIEVVETDMGDRILQLLGEKPSHPVAPAAHLSAKEISEGLKNIYGKSVEAKPEEIIDIVLKDIKKSIARSRIGITGANAICAEEGSILIVHNEGNVYEMIRKEKLIVVTGIDKIYPNIEEAINMIKIITYNSIGATVPSFIEIISGVTKTADIEQKIFSGIHDPKEVVLVLVDDRRREIGKIQKEMLLCIGCGLCLVDCPAYGTRGLEYGAKGLPGGRGLVYKTLYNGAQEKALEYCLTCMHCVHNCPLKIDLPAHIRGLRSGGSLAKEFYLYSKAHAQWLYLWLKDIFQLGDQFDRPFDISNEKPSW